MGIFSHVLYQLSYLGNALCISNLLSHKPEPAMKLTRRTYPWWVLDLFPGDHEGKFSSE